MLKLWSLWIQKVIEYPNWMIGVDFVLTMLVLAAAIAAVVVWFDAKKDYSLYYKNREKDEDSDT